MRLLIIVFIFLSSYLANATHVIGGNVGYKYLKTNTYEISIDLFLDCFNGIPAALEDDKEIIVAFYDAKTNELINYDEIQVNELTTISKTDYNCLEYSPNSCIRAYKFYYTKQINPGANGVYVVFQRCCRNRTIKNIVDPVGTGATYYVKIPPTSVLKQNSSPRFKNLPPNFLCNNVLMEFDYSANDDDSDSLVYSLVVPYTYDVAAAGARPAPPGAPPYTKVIMNSPYSIANFMNGYEKLKINSSTGLLTVIPSETGQFVIGVKVEEYRNGTKIGEMFQDYQFNVVECQFSVVANFDANPFECLTEVNFNNNSTGDDLKFSWDFGEQNLNNDTSIQLNPTWKYRNHDEYKVRLIARGQNGCNDTFQKTIQLEKPDTIYSNFNIGPKLGCDSLTIFLQKNTRADTFQWNFGDGIIQPKNSPLTNYFYSKPGNYPITLDFFDSNTCNFYVSLKDSIKIIEPTQHEVSFNVDFKTECESDGIVTLSIDTISSPSFVWEFDGLSTQNESPTAHTYLTSGNKVIQLTTTDTTYCVINDSFKIDFKIDDFLATLEKVELYNIFTPNDDAFNNRYCLNTDSMKCLDANYTIYNRYGEIVFEGESVYDCWDGTDSRTGFPSPDGEYFGLFIFKNPKNNKTLRRSNVITIIR
ncbi:PKD domain-containing protein [Bacteroidia bacterium]|nr:PKD domain-containing protein [Bacteroidia bacterium]